jgi:hypothetical protein
MKVVYVANLQTKYDILQKLHHYETHHFFTIQEIVEFYFVTRVLKDDMWPNIEGMKRNYPLMCKDLELIRSQVFLPLHLLFFLSL